MEGNKIYEAISNVMKDVGVVGKNATNKANDYKYRSIDAIMNALNPAMVKNRVIAIPQVLDVKREDRVQKNGSSSILTIVKVKYTFYAEDGSNLEAEVCGEAMDEEDKSLNKAMSAAYKYACFQVFCIPTDEMVDSEKDSDSPEEVSGSNVNPNAKQNVLGIYDRINRTKLFSDDEVLLIGTKGLKGKLFSEIKNKEEFLRFLNHVVSQDFKFEDAKQHEQFLRFRSLHSEILSKNDAA